jgi:hypothetical protein
LSILLLDIHRHVRAIDSGGMYVHDIFYLCTVLFSYA